jgi:hypothetical protein
MNRKEFIRKSLYSGSGIVLLPAVLSAQNAPEIKPQLKPELIKEFVGAGHNNLERVKEMLQNEPNLLSSRYDWGYGDFEEAIEGAAHVGNKEIANYLIEQGARINLFVLTMLGKTNLVKPILEAYPKLIFAKGAHGFTLLHHAINGQEDALDLLAFLKEKGLKETRIKN